MQRQLQRAIPAGEPLDRFLRNEEPARPTKGQEEEQQAREEQQREMETSMEQQEQNMQRVNNPGRPV